VQRTKFMFIDWLDISDCGFLFLHVGFLSRVRTKSRLSTWQQDDPSEIWGFN
jgi:hypothetical protein